jgi:hypothetical protein
MSGPRREGGAAEVVEDVALRPTFRRTVGAGARGAQHAGTVRREQRLDAEGAVGGLDRVTPHGMVQPPPSSTKSHRRRPPGAHRCRRSRQGARRSMRRRHDIRRQRAWPTIGSMSSIGGRRRGRRAPAVSGRERATASKSTARSTRARCAELGEAQVRTDRGELRRRTDGPTVPRRQSARVEPTSACGRRHAPAPRRSSDHRG